MYRLFAMLLLLSSCSSARQGVVAPVEPAEGQTASGFRYVHHLRNTGVPPKPGDFVFFHLYMSNGDSVLFDSRQQPNMPRLQMPASGRRPAQASPVVEGLALMAEGDSLTVFYPIDSLGGSAPAGYENTPFILYTLVMQDIQSAADYREDRPALLAEEQERLKKVLEFARLETRFRWKQYRTGTLGARLAESPGGMQFIPLEISSEPLPEEGQWVSLHYLCIRMDDGTEYSNTFERNREQFFRIGGGSVLPQWEEAVLRFPPGSSLILFVPPGSAGGMDLNPDFPTGKGLVFFLELKPQK